MFASRFKLREMSVGVRKAIRNNVKTTLLAVSLGLIGLSGCNDNNDNNNNNNTQLVGQYFGLFGDDWDKRLREETPFEKMDFVYMVGI